MDERSSTESYAQFRHSNESHAHFHDPDQLGQRRKTTRPNTDRRMLLSNKKVTVTFSARRTAAAGQSSSTHLSPKGSHHSNRSKPSEHKFERFGRYKPKIKKNEPWWTLSKTNHLSVEDNTKRDREGRRPLRDHWPDRDVHQVYNAKYAGPYNSSRHLSKKSKKGGSRTKLKLHKHTKTLQKLFSKTPTGQGSTLIETTAKIYCAAPAPSRQPTKQLLNIDSDSSIVPTTGSAMSVTDNKVAAFYKQEKERLKPKRTIKAEDKAMMVNEKNTAKQMRYLLAHTHFEELEIEALQEMFHELTHHTNEMDRTLFWDVAQNLLGLETRDFGEQMFRFFDYAYDGSIGSSLLRGCLWDLEGMDDDGEKFDPSNIRDLAEAVTKRLQEDKRGFITLKSFARAVHRDPLQLQVLGACMPDPEKVKTMLSMIMEDYTLFETNLSNKFAIQAKTSHWKYAKGALTLMPYLKRLARAPMRSTVFGNVIIQKRVKKPLNPSLSPFGEQEPSGSSRNFSQQSPELELDLLDLINLVGAAPVADLPTFAWNSSNLEVIGFLEEFKARRAKFLNSSQQFLNRNKSVGTSSTVHVATAACEERGTQEGIVMLKSALLFGQDTTIHAYVFTDPKSLVGLSLQLKWTSEVLGSSFLFTVLLKTFPDGWDGNTYGPCSSQRLFFPSALPEVDAVLYLDADTLVLSNLTRIWGIFEEMNETTIAAVAPNTVGPMDKRVYYTPDIPIYGNRGLNTGVMLMNLTRMRDFQVEQRAISIEFLYRGKLWLADQDIYNIIFSISPDKLHMIDCSYNFYYTHCSSESRDTCGREGSCFCEPTFKTGVKILHGVGRSFDYGGFMGQAFRAFKAMDVLTEDTSAVIEGLARSFRELGQPCSNLSAEALYGNALEYLKGQK